LPADETETEAGARRYENVTTTRGTLAAAVRGGVAALKCDAAVRALPRSATGLIFSAKDPL
jgi:hypothetical protein